MQARDNVVSKTGKQQKYLTYFLNNTEVPTLVKKKYNKIYLKYIYFL